MIRDVRRRPRADGPHEAVGEEILGDRIGPEHLIDHPGSGWRSGLGEKRAGHALGFPRGRGSGLERRDEDPLDAGGLPAVLERELDKLSRSRGKEGVLDRNQALEERLVGGREGLASRADRRGGRL